MIEDKLKVYEVPKFEVVEDQSCYNDVVEECNGGYLEEDAIEPCPICNDDPRTIRPREIQTIKETQWSKVGDDCIVSVSNTFDQLEAGYYTIDSSPNIGMFFIKNNIQLNKLYRLPNAATDLILNDISRFWTLEERYKKYNRVFRRNYLLYSAPGTGKTSLINLMCQELIEKYNGIVFSLSTPHELELYTSALRKVRTIEPDRKIITIIEDIDNFVSDSDERTTNFDTYLLNILDGNLKVGGVVTIATTNYIDKIANRYKNRPSRFDRVVEFPLPNAESRRMFIEKTVFPDDLATIDIDEWVNRTDGYTIDHINELILLYFVFGHTEEESFETMNNMVNSNDKLKNNSSVKCSHIGFINPDNLKKDKHKFVDSELEDDCDL